MSFIPAYRKLNKGELKNRLERARSLQEECVLCPKKCMVERNKGFTGDCQISTRIKIASYGPHFGEERPLIGTKGSGTIFFSSCNLKCVFCQNSDISWSGVGRYIPVERLAEIMIGLQDKGCHNINFVTPTHFVPQILEALIFASDEGLNLPLVYNCGGYESISTLKVLNDIVDIYMPDVKYNDPEVSERLSGVKDYPYIVRDALREMQQQVGDLEIDSNGIALRGLIIRHLVLPESLAGTEGIMKFIADEISRDSFVNVMRQYHPANKAREYPPLDRAVNRREYEDAVKAAENTGIRPRG